MSGFEILSIAPNATIQDRGRSGYLRFGVTGGGAMDVYALAEGQALLGNGPDDAALEFAAYGGRFCARGRLWVALSGGDMRTTLNGTPVGWRCAFQLEDGDILDVGAATQGVYGYLHVAGGFQTQVVLGARATHPGAGFGHVPEAGQVLEAGRETSEQGAVTLPTPRYLLGREIRMMWGPQSHYFSDEMRADFAGSTFTATSTRDRMGVRVLPDMGDVYSDAGLSIASDAINLGDIQIPGDHIPAILLADRGSSGGYPRIATVIGADLPAVAQMAAPRRFTMAVVSRAEAVQAWAKLQSELAALPKKVTPLVRDPREMRDLLAYNLVDGMLRGDEYDNG